MRYDWWTNRICDTFSQRANTTCWTVFGLWLFCFIFTLIHPQHEPAYPIYVSAQSIAEFPGIINIRMKSHHRVHDDVSILVVGYTHTSTRVLICDYVFVFTYACEWFTKFHLLWTHRNHSNIMYSIIIFNVSASFEWVDGKSTARKSNVCATHSSQIFENNHIDVLLRIMYKHVYILATHKYYINIKCTAVYTYIHTKYVRICVPCAVCYLIWSIIFFSVHLSCVIGIFYWCDLYTWSAKNGRSGKNSRRKRQRLSKG